MNPTSDALDRFGVVALDEMVAEAALLARVDRKYVVPRAELDPILRTMDPATRVLEIDCARRFAYESVYFDTPDLLSFRMAAHPRRRRFKLRTRAYLDTDTAFLEIKTRGARGTTVKERSAYDLELRSTLTDVAREEVTAAFVAIGVDPGRADELEATLVTRYSRSTLLAPDGSARATIDTGLRWDGLNGAGFTLPGLAIVETKSPSSASAIDRLLWRSGHRPVSVSKYATGLAALRSELPRNRWDRLLRGAFSDARHHPHARPTTPSRTEELPCAAA
ncbi:polyphosphate polymerase domain-containing protein [Microbacterium sp. cf332]|uniref:polyphosphate polymerase domain-containing protein n=1 Tax=Microbacterium sp. cf332 TaxID=1761804 RepID=UPI00088EC874|nr:polyphosphate polymerase domain-containing protein [Microbacterium sp. cf332]SDQ52206.1 VTC domain-containing protein [Microbacterium sp. cf332]